MAKKNIARVLQTKRPMNVERNLAGNMTEELRLATVHENQEIRAAASIILQRLAFLRQAGITFNGARDLYEVLGYDRLLTNRQYRDRYARGGLAGRVVDVFPNACWRGAIELVEGDYTDSPPELVEEKLTAFEKSWKQLDKRIQIQTRLRKVDMLAGLSSYAVLLIGVKGKQKLDTPLPKGTGPDDIMYLSAFCGGGGPGGDTRSRAVAMDADVTIMEFDVDVYSPRFGLPKLYQLRRTDVSSPELYRPVHWSRVVHISENALYDEVYGQPSLERVWNLFDDLDKTTGGGAEAFWLRANAGLHLDIDKEMELLPDDIQSLKDQSEKYKHQLTRWLRTRGVKVETLGSEVANFGPPADAIITQIAGSKGIPKRILTGSEMGELASSQDRDNWRDQVVGRQLQYCGPFIVRPLVDRLVSHGYLPAPKNDPANYAVRWPHLQVMTETERSAGAAQWATTNKSNGSTVFGTNEIRKHWYGMDPIDPKDVQAIAPTPGGGTLPNEEPGQPPASKIPPKAEPGQPTDTDDLDLQRSLESTSPLMKELAQAIKDRDKNTIMEILDLELEFLHRQEMFKKDRQD